MMYCFELFELLLTCGEMESDDKDDLRWENIIGKPFYEIGLMRRKGWTDGV